MVSLVFLPGAGGRAAFWLPVAELLADLGPTTRLAWPGFGDEPADAGIGSLDDLYAWMLARLPSGTCHVIAQSMGGVLATRLAIERPARVATLVLCATSGGVDVTALGGIDWRPAYRAELPDVPAWFEADRTDLTASLSLIRAPTLVVHGDADPIAPPAVADLLCQRIPDTQRLTLPGDHDFAHRRAGEVADAIRRFICSAGRKPVGAQM